MVMVSLAYDSIQMASASTESKDDTRCLTPDKKTDNCVSLLPKEECKDIVKSTEFEGYKCSNVGSGNGHDGGH